MSRLQRKLLSLNSDKACGPHHIPGRLIKEFAFGLAEPLRFIFNESLISGSVNQQSGKTPNMTPVPKSYLLESEDYIRPISIP